MTVMKAGEADLPLWLASEQRQLRFPLPPKTLASETSDRARYLSLCLRARSPAAVRLVQDLVLRLATEEGRHRRNKRAEIGTQKLIGAVGAVVGGVLEAWDRPQDPLPVWRSNQAQQFTGSPVGRRQFKTVTTILVKLKLLRTIEGSHPTIEPSYVMVEPKGRSARYWPTKALLELAVSHGLTPGTVKDAFEFVAPRAVPQIKGPVALRPLEARGWGNSCTRPRLAGSMEDAEAQAFAIDVVAHNALAKGTKVTGCRPPRWFRLFLGSWRLHGRWYAAGGDGTYWRMSVPERSALTINGEDVVELDVRASHLTILQGLVRQKAELVHQAQVAIPCVADPYAGLGVPREVAKRWVLELLGKGRLPGRWSKRANNEVRSHNLKVVQAAVLKYHPYLADPTWIVPEELALELDVPKSHLPVHVIMALESEAITRAMRELRGLGILSLPVHDSLIVPASAEAAARRAIITGYQQVCGIIPVVGGGGLHEDRRRPDLRHHDLVH